MGNWQEEVLWQHFLEKQVAPLHLTALDCVNFLEFLLEGSEDTQVWFRLRRAGAQSGNFEDDNSSDYQLAEPV